MLKRIRDEFYQASNLLGFTAIQTTGQIASMAVPLVVAWLFSADMWGRYSLCEPVIFFFSALLILSAKTPFIIYANQERGQTQSIRKSFSIQCVFLGSSIVFFLLTVLCFGSHIARFANIGTAELFYIGLAFFAIIMKDFSGNLFMAMGRRISNAFVELGFGILTLGFIFFFYFLGWIDLRSVFLSYFLASLLVLIGSLVAVNVKMFMPFTFDREQFSEMLRFTLWMMAGTVSSYIMNWTGLLILRKYASIEDIGTYNLAFKFFKGFVVLMCIIPSYFLPYISENIKKPEKIHAYLFKKRPRIVAMGVLGYAVVWLAMPYVLNLMYDDKFVEAAEVVRILIIGGVMFLFTSMYGPILSALKAYKFQQFANISQLMVNVILSVLLIPRFGVAGAAAATVISYLYLTILIECYYRFKLV